MADGAAAESARQVAVKALALVRRDLGQAGSEAGVLQVRAMRSAPAVVAIADSRRHQLVDADKALQAARTVVEKDALQGSIS